MSLSTEQKRGEDGFQLHKHISANEQKRRELLAANIELLDKMFTEHLYKDVLGDESADWVAYLAQLEVFYTRSEVFRWLKIKRRLVESLGYKFIEILDVPITRLDQISRFAVSKEASDDLLAKARTFTSRDWSEEMNKLQGKHIPDDGHRHDFRKFKVCKVCGKKENEHID